MLPGPPPPIIQRLLELPTEYDFVSVVIQPLRASRAVLTQGKFSKAPT